MAVVVEDNISQDGISYYLCRGRAMSLVEAVGILDDELNYDAEFHECWLSSQEIYQERMAANPLYDWEQMDKRCHLAVICYLLDDPNVSRRMNHYCRQALPEPASWYDFPYKGLWFFLVLAFEILPPLEVNVVFRGISRLRRMPDYRVPAVQFLSATLFSFEAARYAGPDGLLLIIKGVSQDYIRDVSIYAVHPDKREVLIWPFVTFSTGEVHGDRIDLAFVGATPDDCVPRYFNGYDHVEQ